MRSLLLLLAFLTVALAITNDYEAREDAYYDRLLSEPYDQGIAEEC